MLWLTWRQHRAALAAGAGALAALALFVLSTGNRMRDQFSSLGLDRCTPPIASTCQEATIRFQQANSGLQFAVVLFLVVPALVGLFWGAPLVAREIEQGTHRLAWTQSVTRRRWLVVKVGALAAAAAVLFGASAALLSWWADPIVRVRPQRMASPLFDLIGVAPAAYALAALAIGVAAGTVVRRTMPALGLTLVAFLVLRLVVGLGLRPHYMEPVTVDVPWQMSAGEKEPERIEDGWILSEENLTADSRLVSDDGGIDIDLVSALCPDLPLPRPGPPAPSGAGGNVVRAGPLDRDGLTACADRLGFHVVTRYHPEDRFWRFQLTEAALYVTVSGAALALSAWCVRRRIS
jgi:hypothetical protein